MRSNVPEDDTCADTIQELTEAGCQILFSAASGHETTLIEAAVSHPDLPVCQAGGSQGNQDALDNTHTHYAQVYQAWYLAGIAAGQKTETNRLGYVAAFPSAQGISAFTAYYLGAKSVNDQVTMVVRYTNAWSDAEQETQLAQGLIDLGCDVLSYNTNTAATAEAAQANGVFVVGCHQDIAEVAPDAALTAVQIHWEAYYTYALTCLLEGEEISQDWCGSYADRGLRPHRSECLRGGLRHRPGHQDAAAALEEGASRSLPDLSTGWPATGRSSPWGMGTTIRRTRTAPPPPSTTLWTGSPFCHNPHPRTNHPRTRRVRGWFPSIPGALPAGPSAPPPGLGGPG